MEEEIEQTENLVISVMGTSLMVNKLPLLESQCLDCMRSFRANIADRGGMHRSVGLNVLVENMDVLIPAKCEYEGDDDDLVVKLCRCMYSTESGSFPYPVFMGAMYFAVSSGSAMLVLNSLMLLSRGSLLILS